MIIIINIVIVIVIVTVIVVIIIIIISQLYILFSHSGECYIYLGKLFHAINSLGSTLFIISVMLFSKYAGTTYQFYGESFTHLIETNRNLTQVLSQG